MPLLSTAKLFFDRIVAEGTPFLENLVSDHTPETEWLDFKCGDHLDDAQIKVTWSKALCGFANNQGGVLIWGIDARFDKNSKVDAACEIRPVPDPNALRSRLVQIHPTATEPPLAGADIRTFFRTGSQGPGFVVCYVPESDIKPHRAELLENKPYMMRIGDSFKNPSPSLLRNLFFPRSSASLGITVESEWDSIEVTPSVQDMPSTVEIRYEVSVQNLGLVSVKDFFVIVETKPGRCQVNSPYRIDLAEKNPGTGLAYPRTIHPASSVQLCTIRQHASIVTEIGANGRTYLPMCEHFLAHFTLFVTDMRPVQIEISLSELDVRFRGKKSGTPSIADR